jgi:hypothetical protein
MSVPNPILLRNAGYAAYLAAAVQLVSALSLWLFFGGAGEIFGPVNDLLVAIAMALLVLPVLGLRALIGRTVGPWFAVVSTLALGGLAVAAVGQLLLVAGVISLEMSFVTGTAGVLPILAWMVGVGVAARRSDALPDRLAPVTVAVLLAVALSIGSMILPAAGVIVLSGLLVVALAGWLMLVGSSCLAAVRSTAAVLA